MLIKAGSWRPFTIRLRYGTVCFMVMLLRRCHWNSDLSLFRDQCRRRGDPVSCLVGARFAGVGKDPPRRGHVAVRVAPANLDLWCAGVLSAAVSPPPGQRQHRLSHGAAFCNGTRHPNVRD